MGSAQRGSSVAVGQVTSRGHENAGRARCGLGSRITAQNGAPPADCAEGEARAEMQREGSAAQGAAAGSTALPQRKAGQRGGRGSQAPG